ncbi:Mss4-like protein [Xylariaceae sp. FL1651]|nr:Mss4-like protein [Xylariaceae sp. FL1651]
MSARTASCLCGSIKAAIQGDPFRTNLCHCSSCQKNTGGAFGSLAAYTAEKITFTESEPSVMKTYEDTSPESGRVLYRSFCGKCGSPVRLTRPGNDNIVVVPVGIIDGDKSAFKPQLEFFCRGKADWVGAIKDSQMFEAMPPAQPSQRS